MHIIDVGNLKLPYTKGFQSNLNELQCFLKYSLTSGWKLCFKFKMRISAFYNLKSNRALGSGYFT